jgi:hypothetical protein
MELVVNYEFISFAEMRRTAAIIVGPRGGRSFGDSLQRVSSKLSGPYPKICTVLQLVASEPLRYVVFCGRLATVACLEAALAAVGVPGLPFIGEMDVTMRDAALSRWRSSDHAVLLMTYEAGGVGLNLQAGDAVVHVDVPTTQLLTQAQHRVQRPPRRKPVFVHFVQCQRSGGGNTLDHAVKDLADARRSADDAVMQRYASKPRQGVVMNAGGGAGGGASGGGASGGGSAAASVAGHWHPAGGSAGAPPPPPGGSGGGSSSGGGGGASSAAAGAAEPTTLTVAPLGIDVGSIQSSLTLSHYVLIHHMDGGVVDPEPDEAEEGKEGKEEKVKPEVKAE